MKYMDTELEIKFLDVDKDDLRKRLHESGANLVKEERLMKRRNFDFPDRRLEKEKSWIRVRDEGDKITLAFKKLVDRSLYGLKELSLEVNDFEKTCEFLLAAGLTVKNIEETKRETWKCGDVEITIDIWPWIPSFVEIEGKDEEGLRSLVSRLGFRWEKGLHGSVETAYQNYFNITDQELYDCKEAVFGETPAWLEVKRINKTS